MAILYKPTTTNVGISKTERVQTALDAVLSGREHANHLSPDEIARVCEAVEATCVGLTHTVRGFWGTRVIIRGATATHKRYGVRATSAVCERRESGWRLVEVNRGLVFPGQRWVEIIPAPLADERYIALALSDRAAETALTSGDDDSAVIA